MKKYLLILLVVSDFFQVFCNVTTNGSRFELNKKNSLIPPFDEDLYKFWLFRNVIIPKSKDRISLTSWQINDLGAVWNLIPIQKASWKAELTYTAFCSQDLIADGIAFWLVPSGSLNHKAAHSRYGGPNSDFTGLMIAIDSYQFPSNYTLKRNKDQAAIIVVYNAEPRYYDWNSEGYDIFSGRCLVKNRYRSSTKIISKLVVEYFNEVLLVYHTNGTNQLELCTIVRNLKIPPDYVIGLSASNGGYVGVYEVHSFKFYDVPDPEPQRKLMSYFYIVSGLLIFVTLIGFSSLVYFLRQFLCKKRSLTQKPESKQISNNILNLEGDLKNKPIQAISLPVSRIPLEPQSDSNSYEDIDEKKDVYDIINDNI